MASLVRLAHPIGVQNGTNKRFATTTSYDPSRITVRVNDADVADGDLVRTDPGAGLFDLPTAPAVDDVLLVAYEEPTVDQAGQAPQIAAFVERYSEFVQEGGNVVSIVAGSSGKLLTLRAFNLDGTPYDLTDCILYFQANEDSEKGTLVFDKTSLGMAPEFVPRDQTSPEGIGIADVTFTQSETLAAAAKVLSYDMWVRTAAENFVPVVQQVRLHVRASVRTTFPTS